MPTLAWIDAVTPDTPVPAYRHDLHMMLLQFDSSQSCRHRSQHRRHSGWHDRARQEWRSDRSGQGMRPRISSSPASPASAAEMNPASRAGITLGLSKGVTPVHCPEKDWNTFDTLGANDGRGGRRHGPHDRRFRVEHTQSQTPAHSRVSPDRRSSPRSSPIMRSTTGAERSSGSARNGSPAPMPSKA